MNQIQHHSNQYGGSFCYELEGVKLAEMVYALENDGRMIIQHTEVDTSLRGKGIGKQLLAALVEHVRTKNLRVLPLCSFARLTFERTPEWQDVLG